MIHPTQDLLYNVPSPDMQGSYGMEENPLVTSCNKTSLSLLETDQQMALYGLVFVISILVLFIVWCSLCHILVIQWLSGGPYFWNNQPSKK